MKLHINKSEIIEVVADIEAVLNGHIKFYLGVTSRELVDMIEHAVNTGDFKIVDAFIIATECANVERLKELVAEL